MVLVWEEAVDTLLVTERKEIAIIMCHVKVVTGDCVRRAAMALQPLLRLGSADEGSRVVVAGSRSKREFT